MEYVEPCLPFEFPPAMLDRLARIRTVAVELDYDELVLKATFRSGLTTRDDYRDLCWVLGSRAWPPGWFHDLHAEGRWLDAQGNWDAGAFA